MMGIVERKGVLVNMQTPKTPKPRTHAQSVCGRRSFGRACVAFYFTSQVSPAFNNLARSPAPFFCMTSATCSLMTSS